MNTQTPAKARRLQVQRLIDLLYDASHHQPQSEETQLLIRNLSQVLVLMTGMEWHRVRGIRVDAQDIFRPDHVPSFELERYAGHITRHSLAPEVIQRVRDHLVDCTYCRSMLIVFESQLICGSRVRLVPPERRHYPCFDPDEVSGGPVTLGVGWGIAAAGLRDDQ